MLSHFTRPLGGAVRLIPDILTWSKHSYREKVFEVRIYDALFKRILVIELLFLCIFSKVDL